MRAQRALEALVASWSVAWGDVAAAGDGDALERGGACGTEICERAFEQIPMLPLWAWLVGAGAMLATVWALARIGWLSRRA